MGTAERAPSAFLRRVDARQLRVRPVGFSLAVIRQFAADGCSQLAALIAYYAFVCIFPLLAVFTTVLGFVLDGHPDWQQRILDTALGRFPVIGDELQRNLGTLPTSGTALVVGLAFGIWVGLAALRATRSAFDTVWDGRQPARERGWRVLVRSLSVLVVIGAGLVIGTALVAIVASLTGAGILARVGVIVASVAWNTGLFLLVFRLLTTSRPDWAQLWPGAVFAAVASVVLQSLGALYLTRVVARSTSMAGAFGVVIGLVVWLYIQAQMVLLATELNVVRARRSWPRSLFVDDET